jgi:hypothetical protein
MKKISFLGHILSEEGISVDPKKVEVITRIPLPISVKQIRQFMGAVKHYKKHSWRLWYLSVPIPTLIRQDVSWKWTEECQKNFELIKEELTTAPVLAYPDLNKEFIMDTDAEDTVIGQILSQEHNNLLKVVCYGGRMLTPREINYTVTEKECLAVVDAVKRWGNYLYGAKFIVRITKR